jgi:hypothetical protein
MAARRAVVVLLAVHTALLAYSAYVHSPTLNEPGHLVAGLSHWKFGRYELYRNNPPLVRLVAALPVMAVGYQEDWTSFYNGPGAMPQFLMGEDFVAANGQRSFFLFMIARWACIPFSWIGAIVCYLWARDLYGRAAGVLACAIWCFEPNILAHASLITPDAHAAALGLAACYTFWRWLKNPTWSQAALTGVVLGLAELAKTTLILFYPLWPLMWLAYRWPWPSFSETRRQVSEKPAYGKRDWLREAGMLTMRMAIGLYVLNFGYGFEGSLAPLGEYHFVSDLLTGTERGTGDRIQGSGFRALAGRGIQESGDGGQPAGTSRQRANPRSAFRTPLSTNRFADSWLAALPAPVPKNYLLGIDIQQRSFEHWGRPSYLRGQWRDRGWWYYYLYAAAIKVPLGLLILGILALILRFSARKTESLERLRGLAASRRTIASSSPGMDYRDEFILLIPPLIIFVVVSSQTAFSEHLRYAMPSFPFAFIWLTGAVRSGVYLRQFLERSPDVRFLQRLYRRPSQGFMSGALAMSLAPILLLWSFSSSLWIFPHSLSYFNELVGGPLNGPKHLLSSNVDWGQDLRRLKWRAERSDSGTLRLAYFGLLNPRHLGVDFRRAPDEGLPASRGSSDEGEWFALSSNFLYGYPWFIRVRENESHNYALDALSQWRRLTPSAYAGYSLYIYEPPFVIDGLAAAFHAQH